VGVVPADFDEDGFIDLAVANARDNTVSVLIGSCTPPPRPAPVLTAVRDVPADQGGRVFVTWLSSELDVAGARTITGYRVWRRITAAMFAALGGHEASVSAGAAWLQIIATPRPDGTEDVTYWEAIATLPAENLEGYGYTASTFEDSSASSTPFTAFYVSALTPDPFVFYPSNVDSGYSVDNTRPGSPRALAPGRTEEGVHLLWEAVDEPDLASYRVYRGAARDFVPAQENLIVVTSDTTYLDPSGSEGSVYKVSSVDLHDNESDYTLIELGPATAVSGEKGSSLAGVWPNPTSRIVVSFILGDRARAELELADVSGRIVLRRPVGDLGPGTHRMDLTEDVYLAPGVYFVRLHAGGRVLATRVCLLR